MKYPRLHEEVALVDRERVARITRAVRVPAAVKRLARGAVPIAIVGFVVAARGAGIAAADDADAPTHLEYRASRACPSEEAFVARVRARMPRVRLVGRGEEGRVFTIELGAAGGHTSGSLTTKDGAGSQGTRRIEAKTCDELADALALMLVLAIDPQSLAAPPLPAADATAPNDAGVAPDAAALSAAASGLPGAAPVASPDAAAPLLVALVDAAAPPEVTHQVSSVPSPSTDLPEETPPPRSDVVRVPPRHGTHHFFAGADFVVATAATPVVLLTAAPVIGARTTFRSIGASLRGSFLHAGTGTISTSGGAADYTWTVGRLDACAMLWPDRAFQLGACARVEGGVLDVTGRDIAIQNTQHAGWLAAGVLARGEWAFFEPLFMGLDAGPAFRMATNRFYFLQNTTVYDVPVVGLWAEIGVGAHFFLIDHR